jgi:hypothetical protein
MNVSYIILANQLVQILSNLLRAMKIHDDNFLSFGEFAIAAAKAVRGSKEVKRECTSLLFLSYQESVSFQLYDTERNGILRKHSVTEFVDHLISANILDVRLFDLKFTL